MESKQGSMRKRTVGDGAEVRLTQAVETFSSSSPCKAQSPLASVTVEADAHRYLLIHANHRPLPVNQTPATTGDRTGNRRYIHHNTHVHQGRLCSNLPLLFRVLSLPSLLSPLPKIPPSFHFKPSQTARAQRPSAR